MAKVTGANLKVDIEKLKIYIKDYKVEKGLTNKEFTELLNDNGCDVKISTVERWQGNNAPETISETYLKPVLELINKDLNDIVLEDTSYNDDFAMIKYYETTKASAGTGVQCFEECEPTIVPFAKQELRKALNIWSCKDIHMIKVEGDSMTPTIPEDAMAIFSEYKGEQVKEGVVYVVRDDEEILIKRLIMKPQIMLLSDNPKYPPRLIDNVDNFSIIGRVLGFHQICKLKR
ncbi:S24 family peptidase [Campylobacter sp. RM9333]|uniref:S24 family peptidase n=1 Tax=Campylobacter sp. RM9333 TaxID=2735731 RepID=UPI001E01ECE0|nr:S24 family peptidase [Campylobacter sp. RM9333]